ncbi:uncharacterized protein LOC127750218 [Frankliniella occidentalis]|uniref:Uncharacterized protein LOC127750218 n=1 Tax=Frankliniella occidentalis TaxID=133901 RepID=A0A9C6X111_FRAOC|nr:uncharacterized protein LOC127750218 [Frankliniella occidentalis]
MDCVRCNRPFVTGERPLIPKVLPCGHTVCLRCLREQLPVSECPIAACRQAFNGPPEELPTNLALVNVLNVMVRDFRNQGLLGLGPLGLARLGLGLGPLARVGLRPSRIHTDIVSGVSIFLRFELDLEEKLK